MSVISSNNYLKSPSSYVVFLTTFIFIMLAVWVASLKLDIQPGSEIVKTDNYFFSADLPVYVEKVRNRDWWELSSKHALRQVIWIPMVRQFEVFFDTEDDFDRSLLAVLLFNAICMALSIAIISTFVYGETGSYSITAALTLIQATSTTFFVLLAADHFAQSYLLMVIATILAFCDMSFKKALVIQFVLAVLIAGTTTTNMFFSGLILFFLLQKHQIITIKYNKALYPLGFIAFTLILFAFYATYDPANSASSMYNRFFNFRIFESPTVFLQYAISSLTFPIMSAPPLFTEIAPHTITLEPILFSRMHALFLLCTFILLFIIVKALYDMHVNPNKKLLFNLFVSWLLFNIIFHNVWGDDYALYFPHFGFLLFFLLASFCKKLNLTTIFGISTMIIVNQSLFIYDLHSLVHKVG